MPNLLSILIESSQIVRLQNKFANFGPYGTKAGLQVTADYFNNPSFKNSMYPPSQSGSPFMWSSDRQRRKVFALGLPSVRTMELANQGEFTVDENNLLVGYTNTLPMWIYVLHPQYQIIGHRLRGWIPVNRQVVDKSPTILGLFKQAFISAWDRFTG